MTLKEIRIQLYRLGNKQTANILQRFFKTGPGEYGEGDIFLGIRVPILRKLACQYSTLPNNLILSLLRSSIHEERVLALLVMLRVYSKADEPTKKRIFKMYLD